MNQAEQVVEAHQVALEAVVEAVAELGPLWPLPTTPDEVCQQVEVFKVFRVAVESVFATGGPYMRVLGAHVQAMADGMGG